MISRSNWPPESQTTIEEEIFFPTFLEATEETDIHHEAEVEHAGSLERGLGRS
jgi:hypothetical protein